MSQNNNPLKVHVLTENLRKVVSFLRQPFPGLAAQAAVLSQPVLRIFNPLQENFCAAQTSDAGRDMEAAPTRALAAGRCFLLVAHHCPASSCLAPQRDIARRNEHMFVPRQVRSGWSSGPNIGYQALGGRRS